MASCYGGYKQLFARGQNFTYSLDDIGLYFKDYLDLMDHWHKTLPKRILTVNYEDVVLDFENQVEKILHYCDLSFETHCFEFYKNQRAIRTASSEQVRQPIYTAGLEQWKNFSDHLSPLKKSLGKDVLKRFNIE